MVRACHNVFLLLQNPSQGGHSRTTNTHEVNVTWMDGSPIEGGGKFSKRCLIVICESHCENVLQGRHLCFVDVVYDSLLDYFPFFL